MVRAVQRRGPATRHRAGPDAGEPHADRCAGSVGHDGAPPRGVLELARGDQLPGRRARRSLAALSPHRRHAAAHRRGQPLGAERAEAPPRGRQPRCRQLQRVDAAQRRRAVRLGSPVRRRRARSRGVARVARPERRAPRGLLLPGVRDPGARRARGADDRPDHRGPRPRAAPATGSRPDPRTQGLRTRDPLRRARRSRSRHQPAVGCERSRDRARAHRDADRPPLHARVGATLNDANQGFPRAPVQRRFSPWHSTPASSPTVPTRPTRC